MDTYGLKFIGVPALAAVAGVGSAVGLGAIDQLVQHRAADAKTRRDGSAASLNAGADLGLKVAMGIGAAAGVGLMVASAIHSGSGIATVGQTTMTAGGAGLALGMGAALLTSGFQWGLAPNPR